MTPNWPRWAFLATLVAPALVGCDRPAGPAPTLRVAAASDLQRAMPVLVSAFRAERQAKGVAVEVDVTLGASGQLAEQIRQGGPFDVFLSANREFVEKLGRDGSVRPDSVRPYARGSLVMAINSIFGLKVRTVEDLKDPKIKAIAIANPETAPYGKAAKQAMERLGLWDALKDRVVPAESVRQAMQLVEAGEAEVGFVGRSLAERAGIEAVAVPPGAYDPIVQALGLVARRGGPEAEARAFADFILGPTGQGVLRDLGFGPPPGPEASRP